MVNIVVIAHSEIANSFADCAEHILGKRITNMHILAVKKSEDAESMFTRAKSFIDKISTMGEVLILTDIFGGTPSNIATKLAQSGKVEVITGLNLPMLIRALAYAKNSLNVCLTKTLDGGKNGIIHISGENS